MAKKHLAIDLGASNGRAILGSFDGERFTLDEIHRFPNDPVAIGNSFVWDTYRLLHEIKTALAKQLASGGADTVGIDTWGVDYGYIDRTGTLLGSHYNYRDERTAAMDAEVAGKISAERQYAIAGIQSQNINTLYQLAADLKYRPHVVSAASAALWTPDLLGYFLTGERVSEYTIASTGGFLDAVSRSVSDEILRAIDYDPSLLAPVVMPGQRIAPLRSSLDDSFASSGIALVSVPSHDTASAVLAIPSLSKDVMFISSGTWSIMGVVCDEPVLSSEAMELGFSNEGGAFGRITFIKNIMGLWLEQESRRQWRREGSEYTYDELSALAASASPGRSLIDPLDVRFHPAGDMPRRIAEYCRATGQDVPETPGEIVRCVFDSLALCYRRTAEGIERLIGKKYASINMIGGGTREVLLCRITANATKRAVIAGPAEATALGNIAMQAYAAGEISSEEQLRDAVCASSDTETYLPDISESEMWDEAYERFLKLGDAR